MAESYVTHNVLLDSADFHVLIIEFPPTDVNDRLALLSHEKGLIPKHFYEDFVIGTCMANAGPFFYHVRRRPELLTKLADIRKEALGLIYQYSPSFKPDNIVINQNNVLKVKSTTRKDEKTRPLSENDLWSTDPPLSKFGPAVVTSSPSKKTDNPFRDGGVPVEDRDEESGEEVPENPFADVPAGGDTDVPYEIVGHKWNKVGLYINVRVYEETETALVSLLGGTPFESSRGYHLLIVERCIEDFADVFQLLDEIGISKTCDPAVLVEELYSIAVEHNPFLKLESVDLKMVRDEFKKQQKTKLRSNRRTAQAGSAERVVSARKSKKFSDLPRETLLSLGDKIKEKIVGQDAAVDNIADAVQRAAVGLKRDHEPLGVFLFTGITGTGKTETSRVLAECLDVPLIRVDCQDYQQAHEVAKLSGSPPGFVGYDDGGHLTKEVAKSPFSVVLFDEVEKAHSNFHERLLQIIDNGEVTDNKGKKVSFQECIIVMTSNIGVQEVAGINQTVGFGDVSAQTESRVEKAREAALKHKFKPEFLNRIDEVVHFRKLEKEDYLHILDILLAEVKEQITKSQNISLSFKAAAKDFLLDKKYGARPLRRAIKKYVNTPLARAILSQDVAEGSRLIVGLSSDKVGLVFKTSVKQRKSDDGS
jgi:ATP-dependent protease Clp ATPase subunit